MLTSGHHRAVNDYFIKSIKILADDQSFAEDLHSNFFNLLPTQLRLEVQRKICDQIEA